LNTSLPNKRWIIAPRITEEVNRELEAYPPYIRQLLFNRGIHTLDEANRFLSASSELGSPFLLLDLEKAVERLLRAINEGEKIIVYGDYDVDGVTATVMMVEALRLMGGQVERYIPNRFDEGYGLNIEAIEHLAKDGAKVILTVDCGISHPVKQSGHVNWGLT
jgi:single-stranded-DNA-specific exonuclease